MPEFMFHSVSCGAKPAAWIFAASFAAVSTVVVPGAAIEEIFRVKRSRMGPREILAELDRLGVALWWRKIGADQHSRIETSEQVSPQLRAALDAHSETLLAIITSRPGDSEGLYYRPPRSRDVGDSA